MRQLGKTGLLPVVLLVLAMFGCGGSSPNEPSSVFISPPDDTTTSPYTVTNTQDAAGNSIHLAGSLNYGDVLLLSATVFGSKGTNVTNANVAWSSSNTSLLTTSTTLPSGYACVTGFHGCTLVCAGTWDSANIDCIPPATGTAGGPITVSATSGAVSGTVTVYVHPKVDKLLVNSAAGGCVSLGGRTQLSATAYSGSTALTSSGPGNVIGPIFWQIANAGVASFGTTTPNGVLTTVAPGGTTIVASIRPGLPVNGSTPAPSISSSPVSFLTCPISSIHVYVSGGSSTSTTIAPSGTSQLAADVFDSSGTLITSAPIRFFSSQPAAATVSNTAGLVTGVAAGTSAVTAACSGTSCNIGLPPIFSNVVTASVTGSTSTTVYAAASGSTTLTPISSGNSLGTAITLPNAANSILFNRAGTKAYIGSVSGVMVFDPVANTVSVLPGTPTGQVIGISPDGNLLVTFNTSGNVVQILDVSSGTSTIVDSSFSVGAAPRVDFSPDSQKAFITAGTTLYSFTSATAPLVPVTLSVAANDVSFLPQGSFAYLAGGAASAITVRTTCDNSQADSKTVLGTPQLISTVPDGTRVVTADSPYVSVMALNTTNVGCPPPLVDLTPSSVNVGLGTFTSQQLVVLPNSSKAYVVTNLPQLLAYDLSANTASTIALANGAQPLNAGFTLDSATLYVGGSDNAVHVINTSTGADSGQVSLSFTPNLLAVRP